MADQQYQYTTFEPTALALGDIPNPRNVSVTYMDNSRYLIIRKPQSVKVKAGMLIVRRGNRKGTEEIAIPLANIRNITMLGDPWEDNG